MKRIMFVQFVFKNYETINFNPEDFGDFVISDIYKLVNRFTCNSIVKLTCAGTFACEIFSDANTTYNPFGEETCDEKKV